jgi:serine/threonine-protein kinase RsbW
MKSDSRAVQLTIPAKPEYVGLSRLALAGLLRFHPIPEETVADLKLALTEACTNSVRHAYADDSSEGEVDIRYELEPDQVVIEVADAGPGFTEPLWSAQERDELSESGLGIAIIRALADELELGERSDGGGSRLRMVKRLR